MAYACPLYREIIFELISVMAALKVWQNIKLSIKQRRLDLLL